MTERTVLHVWSSPRTLSTATMYSFSQRADTSAYDEPLYPFYLKENPEIQRPYRSELLSHNDYNSNGNEVLQQHYDWQLGRNVSVFDSVDLEGGGDTTTIHYLKHIAKFYNDNIDKKLIFGNGHKHVILVRDPLDVIASYNDRCSAGSTGGTCNIDDLGFLKLSQVSDVLCRCSGLGLL